jgi:predicted CopG family antitoxin
MSITITIQDETWEKLNIRKTPGESFDSVINRALMEIPEKDADLTNRDMQQ